MGCIRTITTRTGGDLTVMAGRIGGGLTVTASLVCQVNIARNFVRVKPEYIWLTKGNNYTDVVMVTSDVEWNAE